jgi:hypothetical protein
LGKPLGLEPVSNSQLVDFSTLPDRFDTPSADLTAKPAETAPDRRRRRTRR